MRDSLSEESTSWDGAISEIGDRAGPTSAPRPRPLDAFSDANGSSISIEQSHGVCERMLCSMYSM